VNRMTAFALGWTFPSQADYLAPFPLVFLTDGWARAQSLASRTVDGSESQSALENLARRLSAQGFAACRPVRGELANNGEPVQLPEMQMRALFSEALGADRISRACSIVLGFRDGADGLAKNIISIASRARHDDALNRQEELQAVVLLSPSVGQRELNEITNPFLVIHGKEDSRYLTVKEYEPIKASVMHHQMRYGGVTAHLQVPGTGAELTPGNMTAAENNFCPEVTEQILYWLMLVPRVAEVVHESKSAAADYQKLMRLSG
jgi:pimeloyl-ACP methyl ester carboxylesterase